MTLDLERSPDSFGVADHPSSSPPSFDESDTLGLNDRAFLYFSASGPSSGARTSLDEGTSERTLAGAMIGTVSRWAEKKVRRLRGGSGFARVWNGAISLRKPEAQRVSRYIVVSGVPSLLWSMQGWGSGGVDRI